MNRRAASLALASAAPLLVVACVSAYAQQDELTVEVRPGVRLSKLYLPDGGMGQCEQLNIIGNNCRSPTDFPVACCLTYLSPSNKQLQGPFCAEYSGTTLKVQQVGKGFCCDLWAPGYGPPDWVRFEDDVTPCGFCGGETPNDNQCCTRDRNLVQKFPIQNLADCPNRAQIKEPSFNGCGPEGSGATRAILPQRFGPVQIAPACNGHDICYSTCGSDKGSCDRQFQAAMRQSCSDYFGPAIEAAARAGGKPKDLNRLLNVCLDMSDNYFGAVASMGQDAYDAAQKEFCKCCP